MNIQTVTVELLRAGPRHNQLISPITLYLGVCGNARADRVTLPYEHGELEDRLRDLRYGVTAADDPSRPSRMLERTGRDIAALLAAIPGAAGMLDPKTEQPRTLTHLRIVLSASELAMLPFEAAKVPTGAGPSTVWLALQPRAPVCITRHIRSVSAEGLAWPKVPRVLFAAGPDTPVAQHEQALRRVMAPWRDEHDSLDDRLRVLPAATLAGIAEAVNAAARAGRPFTHVHLLAHGAPLHAGHPLSPVGLALHDPEVITGDRLATALSWVDHHGAGRPLVVTLASCDSGRQSDVRTTDASVAHDLHDQGIPLVVASQFPLSVKGSVPFVERLYDGLLWGEHPLVSMYEVRRQLHSLMDEDVHDWASLVVYEAFPSNMDDRLEALGYWQSRAAHDGALRRLEAEARDGGPALPSPERYRRRLAEVDAMAQRLPAEGGYALDAAGLRASGHKRIAQVAFRLAQRLPEADGWRADLLHEGLLALEQARDGYWRAAKAYMGSWSEPGRLKSSLHWLLGQVLSLDLVLERDPGPALADAAQVSAEIDLDSPTAEGRAWAEVSLAELALIALGHEHDEVRRAALADRCVAHATRFLDLMGRGSEQVFNSSRQFARYADWWGDPAFLARGDRARWDGPSGIVRTARRVASLLQGRSASRPARTAALAPPPSRPEPPPDAPAMPMLGPRGRPAMFDVEMLPAENGDCLLVEYGDPARPHRVLVDCGAPSIAPVVAERLARDGRPLELFVLTHIDADHISGVLPLFGGTGPRPVVHDIWFNGRDQLDAPFLGVKQGEAFSELLERLKLPWNRAATAAGATRPAPIVLPPDGTLPVFTLPGGLTLTLLSPGIDELHRLARHWDAELAELKSPAPALLGRKQPPPPVTDLAAFDVAALAAKGPARDPSVANGSSIAFLAEFDGRSILLTGDAHAEVLARSIRGLQRSRGRDGQRLAVSALKLSHHGSANATTQELLELLDCRQYLVSSNGKMFYHPDREAIARVIVHGGPQPALHFNYRAPLNALWEAPELQQRHGYRAHYPAPDAGPGLRVSLQPIETLRSSPAPATHAAAAAP